MDIIIGLPFAALVIAIVVIRVMWGFREVSELRERRGPGIVEGERRRPSDDFHDLTWRPTCERVATMASGRLGRPLNRRERRTLWRARTVLVLEVAEREIEVAGDAEGVAVLLANLPAGMDRPDPTGWCEV